MPSCKSAAQVTYLGMVSQCKNFGAKLTVSIQGCGLFCSVLFLKVTVFNPGISSAKMHYNVCSTIKEAVVCLETY